MPRYNLKSFSPDGLYHLHAARITADLPAVAHTHGFAEMFLVISGTGVHLVNDRGVDITEGMLLFIRPDDRHCYKVKSSQILHGINVAFGVSTLAYITGRYFPKKTDPWNRKNRLPVMHRLTAPQQQTFIAQAHVLAATSRSLLTI